MIFFASRLSQYAMHALLVTVLFCLGLCQTASACDMPEGFHEYGTFGEKAIYLYHFPMFGSIHAYQVLVEADLSVGGKSVNEEFFAAEQANPGSIFVTSPAKTTDGSPDYWVLPDYTKVGATFNAKVHFRVLGVDHVLFDTVKVTVKNVIFNRLLLSTLAKSVDLQYLYFGNASEGYLLHVATWDPDFDQILKVNPLNSTSLASTMLTVTNHPNSEAGRLKAGDHVAAAIQDGGTKFVEVSRELIEFGISIQR